MKTRAKFAVLLLILFAVSNSFAQYKYDIGLRTSSFVEERIQLQQRFHLNATTIVGTIAYGSVSKTASNTFENYVDSTLVTTWASNHSSYYTVKLGVQQKIDFPKSDQFYFGVTLGSTFEPSQQRSVTTTYALDSSTIMIPNTNPFYFTQETSSEDIQNNWDYLHTKVALSFGMDVPITERLIINAQASFATILTNNLNTSSFYISLKPAISAGFRYQFGRTDS